MENKSHALAAGIFVLTLATLLIGMVLWLTRDRHEYDLYELSTTDTITGLQTQATVRYKGVAVGRVVHIGFDSANAGRLLIRLAVDKTAPIHTERTYAQLSYQGITGLAHIQLDDALTPTTALPPTDDGIPRLPMRSSTLNVLANQGADLLAKVDEATQRINHLLSDGNQQRVTRLLDSLATTSDHIARTASTLNATLHQRVNPAIDTVPTVAADASRALHALEGVGQQATDLIHGLRSSGGPLEQIQTGTRSLAQVARQFEHHALPTITQAAADVAQAARRLEDAVTNLADNPQALLYGSGPIPPGPGESGFVAPPARP